MSGGIICPRWCQLGLVYKGSVQSISGKSKLESRITEILVSQTLELSFIVCPETYILYRYSKIWITAADLQPQSSKLLSKPNLRLKALRRTLRQRGELAQAVREIRVLDYCHNLEDLGSVPVEILDTLATLVAACPNLESVSGLYTTYTHEHSRLVHALSSRGELKEHVWIIGRNAGTWNEEQLFVDRRYQSNLLNGDQMRGFIHAHDHWQSLKTLILCSDHDGTLDHARLFFDTFRTLPALENLMISGFVAHEFDNSHLPSLPRSLRSLRLEDLPGVTEEGLMKHFASTLTAKDRAGLRNLSLTDMSICSLANVALLLNLLPYLRRFTLVTATLLLPRGTTVADFTAPALSNRSLTYLHWEIHPTPNMPSPEMAHTVLAASIRASGFPALRRLRVPSDPRGTLQAVCRPLPLPATRRSDKAYFTSRGACYSCAQGGSCEEERSLKHAQARAIGRAMRALGSWRGSAPASSAASMKSGSREWTRFQMPMTSPTGSEFLSSARSVPPSPGFFSDDGSRSTSDAGDLREPFVRILVSDPDGRVVEEIETAPFLGSLGPGVPEYWLDTDVEGSDEAVMSITDLLLYNKGWGAPGLGKFF